MTISTDELEAFLETEEKAVRAREAEEDRKKQADGSSFYDFTKSSNSRSFLDDQYRVDREENDKRRARKSGDRAEDVVMQDASDGSANGRDRNRRARGRVSSRSRSPRRSSSLEPELTELRPAPAGRDRFAGDYYDGGGRPSRDEYRPGSRGGRDNTRRRSPPRRGRTRSPRGNHSETKGGRGDRSRSPLRNHNGGRRGSRNAPPPEPTSDERDRRTVFVQQLAARLRTKELTKFFEAAGTVVEAQIVKDRVSNRSKGYA